jgi:hypothetical protein
LFFAFVPRHKQEQNDSLNKGQVSQPHSFGLNLNHRKQVYFCPIRVYILTAKNQLASAMFGWLAETGTLKKGDDF